MFEKPETSEKYEKVWGSLSKSDKIWQVWGNLFLDFSDFADMSRLLQASSDFWCFSKSLRFFLEPARLQMVFDVPILFTQFSDHLNTFFVFISFFLCILAAFKLIDTSVKLVRVLLFFSLSHGRIAFGVISVALGRYKNLPQPIRLNKTARINTSFVFVGCSGFSSFPH